MLLRNKKYRHLGKGRRIAVNRNVSRGPGTEREPEILATRSLQGKGVLRCPFIHHRKANTSHRPVAERPEHVEAFATITRDPEASQGIGDRPAAIQFVERKAGRSLQIGDTDFSLGAET